MNYLMKRLQNVEQQTVGVAQNADSIPEAVDMLSPEDRAIVEPYLEARKTGKAENREWPDELHRSMHRYLRAVVERTKALRAAGVPMLSVAQTLQRRRELRAAN